MSTETPRILLEIRYHDADKLHEAQSEANAERQARLAMEEQLLNLQAKLKDLEKQEKSDAESS